MKIAKTLKDLPKVDYRQVQPFQGTLKETSEEKEAKLLASIDKYDFFVPLFIWFFKGKPYTIDGHRRCSVFTKKDIQPFEIPYVEILADNIGEAKTKLLLINSDYGTITPEGYEEFISDMEDIDEVEEIIVFDNLDFEVEEDSGEEEQTEIPTIPKIPITESGDIYDLGDHRLMCGDSTIAADVALLMDGEKADLAHNDPPYGMKKENEGIINDNLNYSDLLDFNKKWFAIQFPHLKENGSWYCWGTDEPLMDIYSEIFKPLIAEQKMTFRNLITWFKNPSGLGDGQNNSIARSYGEITEKCIFIMLGVQGFNNNADNYFEGWEPIRDYLLKSRLEMGWDVPTMKRIVGHSVLSFDHWTSKSQFNFPTEKVYNSLQKGAREQEEKEGKEYNAFKKEYNELKKEYNELKKEYYSTRAYFDNTHDNMTNVWQFSRCRERAGGHATPKPLDLCRRVIKSSCPKSGLVIDAFIGSGSTMIASEETGRKCYGMELEPTYCDVTVKRYINFMTDNSKPFVISKNGIELSAEDLEEYCITIE